MAERERGKFTVAGPGFEGQSERSVGWSMLQHLHAAVIRGIGGNTPDRSNTLHKQCPDGC